MKNSECSIRVETPGKSRGHSKGEMRLRDLKIHLRIAVNVNGNDVFKWQHLLLGAPYRPAGLVALTTRNCKKYELLKRALRAG